MDQNTLNKFVNVLGWEVLMNKHRATFRVLSEEQKDNLDEINAIVMMLAHPTMIKRPILKHEGGYYLGFNKLKYNTILDL
ncbi:ArsC/Spx/MgsR family protein [Candidatus Enterovibrio escicola]|uniref:ArsC/Spx/MgsR family protein n=1 Tax=Candidatus Enterovibrio escicola TaxID=1927127 RepID=UPI001CC226A3|nr:ArsC/Spx/MgsR family protein [Candidatus Enterovibrio escacola]